MTESLQPSTYSYGHPLVRNNPRSSRVATDYTGGNRADLLFHFLAPSRIRLLPCWRVLNRLNINRFAKFDNWRSRHLSANFKKLVLVGITLLRYFLMQWRITLNHLLAQLVMLLRCQLNLVFHLKSFTQGLPKPWSLHQQNSLFC